VVYLDVFDMGGSMIYDPSNKILTMSQTDAEHCGLNMGDLRETMALAGMSNIEIDRAMRAHTIIISMHKGLYK
jgi:hypothetical protein